MSLKSTFAAEVDELISLGKERGVSLDDMIEELELAKDGLEAEIADLLEAEIADLEGDAK
ncbi:hypothetical protein [Phenylobacterium sp.]|jgi:hypothetical protein|uniref:hypothetical protein n=1 Tax=Phenylobacterium sp. TaxID=1871053 RepID=UPI0025FFFB56|nr:hypothetical protein [Phenylobacterium sp.]MCA3742198.1 hypothetical protein [Phenylobacterium sp.]